MFGPIHHLLVEDHRRLEDFLARVSTGLDLNTYSEFRITLLRYIENGGIYSSTGVTACG